MIGALSDPHEGGRGLCERKKSDSALDRILPMLRRVLIWQPCGLASFPLTNLRSGSAQVGLDSHRLLAVMRRVLGRGCPPLTSRTI